MDVIVRHAQEVAKALDRIEAAPRRILRRLHRMVPLARVQEIDALLDGSALVRRGGGGAVCICGAPILLGAQFCATCGRALGGKVDESPTITWPSLP